VLKAIENYLGTARSEPRAQKQPPHKLALREPAREVASRRGG
jgi:hypothetical protein